MVYETPRLFTRPLLQSDVPALSAMLQNEEVMAAWEHPFSDAEVTDWLAAQQNRYRRDGFGLWALVQKHTGRVIGQCGLLRQPYAGHHVVEVAYLLRRDHWHQGYAIEAAKGCKAYAFGVIEAPEVYSMVRDTNLASMNVAIKNGMTVKGRFTKHYHGVDMPHYAFWCPRPGGEAAL